MTMCIIDGWNGVRGSIYSTVEACQFVINIIKCIRLILINNNLFIYIKDLKKETRLKFPENIFMYHLYASSLIPKHCGYNMDA